jgi:hypothetical protein
MPTTRTITPEMQRQLDEVIRLCLDSVTIAEKCGAAPLHGDAEPWTRLLNLPRFPRPGSKTPRMTHCHNARQKLASRPTPQL